MSQTEHASYGYVSDKQALIKRCTGSRARCAQSSAWSEDERYCIDAPHPDQHGDDRARLAGLKILGDHVNSCVAHAFASGDEQEASEKSRELLAAVERFTKTR